MLTQTQPSAVIFTLPQAMLDPLRAAMTRGPVAVTAYDQNNTSELATGRVLLIDDIIDQATATIKVKALFANTDERLWPGEFVNARVLMETQQDVIAIPSAAVRKRGPQGLFTWVVGLRMRHSSPSTTHQASARPPDEVTIVTAGLQDWRARRHRRDSTSSSLT